MNNLVQNPQNIIYVLYQMLVNSVGFSDNENSPGDSHRNSYRDAHENSRGDANETSHGDTLGEEGGEYSQGHSRGTFKETLTEAMHGDTRRGTLTRTLMEH